MTAFEPHPWQAPKAPKLEGPFAKNDRLGAARLVGVPGHGPEDVVVDASGLMFTGLSDGAILEINDNGDIRRVAQLDGRPLGIELYGNDLLVCNADTGLQRVSRQGAVDTLTDAVDGKPLVLTNNAAVADDGTIYFSESSMRWPLAQFTTELIEGQATGRLLRRSPAGEVTVLTTGLHFANGVALDADESSVFVAETGRFRIHRHWLQGDKAGTTEVFAENLPGFPDNLSFANDTLWVAHASPRQPPLDFMASRTWMKKLAHSLPESMAPKAVRHGMVFGYDDSGRVTHNLQDPSGTVAITTSARVVDDRLYVGMLEDPHIAIVDL